LFEGDRPISSLVMAEAIDLDPTLPIVVSEDLMKSHGDRLSGTPFLKGRSVIVQPRTHTLCCKELFLLRPGTLARHWTPGVVSRVLAETIVAPGSQYIYCRREPESSWGRTAENSLEIEEIFRSAGFAVIDPAHIRSTDKRRFSNMPRSSPESTVRLLPMRYFATASGSRSGR